MGRRLAPIALIVALMGATPAVAAEPPGKAPKTAPKKAPKKKPKKAPKKKPPQDDAIDVTVEGERPDEEGKPAEEHLTPRDVGRLPGAFGDAFRAIEVLPGVAPMASGLPHLFIRGATPSASGYFIDGIRVPFLFHLAIGPSVVNPAIIDDVSFYPGAYPARYGRQVGSIVDAKLRPPARRLRLEGSIRFFDAGAYAEVPLLDDKITVLGGGRVSYTAPLLSLVAPEMSLSYWDYQGAAWYHLSKNDRVGFFAFGSRDHLGQNKDGVEKELFGVEFHRVHVRIQRTAPPSEDGRQRGASAQASFTFGLDEGTLSEAANVDARNYALRSDVDVPVFSWLRARGGVDFVADEYEFGGDRVEEKEGDSFHFNIGRAFDSRTAGAVGAYVDLVVTPLEWLEIVPGFRADIFAEDSATQVGLDPRGQVRLFLTDWLTSVTAAGLMHQKPTLLVSVPGFDPVGLGEGLQQALQLSHGFELHLPAEIDAAITGFWHQYDDLTDLSATCTVSVDTCNASDRTDGQAYGLEILLRRSLGERVGGIVSYTLARSDRTIGDDTFTADFDRTHVVNLALGVDLGRGWNAGARLTAYSGRPYSLLAFDDPEEPNRPTVIGQRNALRRQGFFRLDARLEKRWVVADRGWVSLVFEGFNVTLQKELVDFDCRVADIIGSQAGLTCGGQEIGPISIPSIGVSGGI